MSFDCSSVMQYDMQNTERKAKGLKYVTGFVSMYSENTIKQDILQERGNKKYKLEANT